MANGGSISLWPLIRAHNLINARDGAGCDKLVARREDRNPWPAPDGHLCVAARGDQANISRSQSAFLLLFADLPGGKIVPCAADMSPGFWNLAKLDLAPDFGGVLLNNNGVSLVGNDRARENANTGSVCELAVEVHTSARNTDFPQPDRERPNIVRPACITVHCRNRRGRMGDFSANIVAANAAESTGKLDLLR